MSIWLAFFYQYLAQKIIFDNIAKNEKFQHLKMYPNKISSKRTTATAWFYIIICFAWSFGCANNIIGFPGTNAFRCIVSEIREEKNNFYITLPMYLQVYETYNYIIIFELLNTWIHEFIITNSEFLGLVFQLFVVVFS